jgi:tetratricopeptide (TPR) repeat protein
MNSTKALYHLKLDDLKSAEEYFDKALSTVGKGYRGKIEQRNYYDFGIYYYDLKNYELAKSNLEAANSVDEGFKYISEKAQTVLDKIESQK